MLNKLSAGDIAAYKASFTYWMGFWGLVNQWDYRFSVEDMRELEEGRYLGAVVCDAKNRMTLALIPSHWEDTKVSHKRIDRTAFHEVLHVLLSHLDEDMEKVGVQHMIIRMLEVLVYPLLSKKLKRAI